MTAISRQETADRAGVDAAYLGRLVELHLLTPDAEDRFSSGDVRRVRMMRTLDNAGITLEGLAEVVTRGDLSFSFLDNPIYERFASLSDVTFQELSARTGVPVDLLTVIREAIGSAQPQPGDLVREDELAIVPFVQAQVAEGFAPIAIERMLRVTGDSLRRVAETEADWWHTQVEVPRLASGLGMGDLGDATAELGSRLTPLSEQAFAAIHHAQQAHAWTTNIINGIEQVVARAGLHSRLARLPAMCFLDITGYTRLTQERGDAAAAELAEKLARLVQRTSVQHGGRPIKWLGDGVMFHFPDPGPGVLAAIEMVGGVADAGLPPAHIGLHAGPVLFQDGDYYGQTVNIASRIAEYARPGEVVVSQAVVEASGGVAASFTEIGPVELKGVSGALRLHSARGVP